MPKKPSRMEQNWAAISLVGLAVIAVGILLCVAGLAITPENYHPKRPSSLTTSEQIDVCLGFPLLVVGVSVFAAGLWLAYNGVTKKIGTGPDKRIRSKKTIHANEQHARNARSL